MELQKVFYQSSFKSPNIFILPGNECILLSIHIIITILIILSFTTEINNFTAKDIMANNPKTIHREAMAIEVLEALETNSITQILVTDNQNKYVGVVHLHDLIKEGIF